MYEGGGIRLSGVIPLRTPCEHLLLYLILYLQTQLERSILVQSYS